MLLTAATIISWVNVFLVFKNNEDRLLKVLSALTAIFLTGSLGLRFLGQ